MDKIDYLDGQINALLNFISVLIKSHPSPDLLKTNFETATKSEPDSPEDLSVSQAYLDGMTELDRRLKALIKDAIDQR